MAMNSEENKKVGKLFEDTKYTGLIAKLKTDGIPSYQGNMVTITLPSPATAYTVPPSATSTVVPPSARAGSVSSSATAGLVSPSATAGSVSPSATAGSVPSAGASAGSTGIGVQGQARVQPVPANAAPVRASKVPVTVSATSANVVPVPKDVPMKTVTYEWAPPVANKYLVRVHIS